MNKNVILVAMVATLASGLPTAANGDWTSFRNGGGSELASDLPSTWSPDQRIAWQQELPGYGQSTPVILDDRIFLTAVIGPMKEQCAVLCFDLANGQEAWRFTFDSSNPSPSNYMASRAAPTPVVDGQGVYAFFETGDLLAVDLAGELRWHRVLTQDYGKFDNNHGLGASPTQNATHIYLNIEHRGPSYLLAVDKQSGETTWKVERPSGSSWSSPIMAEVGGATQVIVSSAGSVTGYAAADGQQLWTLDGLEGNTVPSPTLSKGLLFIGARLPEFAAEGSMRNNCCIDLNMADANKPTVAWRAEKVVSDYCSPVEVDGVVYFVNKGGILYCVDAQSGELHYTKRLGTDCWGTPLVARGLVYFFGKDGKTVVLQAGKEFKQVAINHLWDEEQPPKPESYVEYSGASPGGERREANAGEGSRTAGEAGRRRGPGGGMLAGLLAGDKNGDGVLEADEIPADFKPMLARIDTNQDGKLDADELKAMAESFAARRAESQASARDPIVYGAIASDGRILIRTGTRLYCVQ